ncbi:hypothetical protein os1_15100 [Comamonadaceae bacterium OS-1]|nr:hypothetical protein os1_15100 [Comamonadaceae bacterium OS-1]
MNFEPFEPFDRSEPLVPPPVVDAPPARYFDRAGCVWIVACVLLAGTVGRLSPVLTQPGGLHQALAALGLGSDPGARTQTNTTVASLPAQGAKPSEATRGVPVKQEVGPLVPAIFRQF